MKLGRNDNPHLTAKKLAISGVFCCPGHTPTTKAKPLKQQLSRGIRRAVKKLISQIRIEEDEDSRQR